MVDLFTEVFGSSSEIDEIKNKGKVFNIRFFYRDVLLL